MPENPRVAYLVSQYPAINHTFILREILALRDLGFDIQVVVIRKDDRRADQVTALERVEQERSIAVFPFNGQFLKAHFLTLVSRPGGYFAGIALACRMAINLKSLLYHLIYFAEAVVAGEAMERAGYRHMHSHFTSTVGLIASKVFGLDYSITIHGPAEFMDVIAFRMREKVAHAKFIATISQYARSQIMLATDPADWDKIEVCPLGVDPSVFQPALVKTQSRSWRVICVGRLAAVKAQRLLIAACARLLAGGLDLRLHLVGTGSDLESLRAYTVALGIEAKVVFEGGKNQDEVIALYKESDVFALASFAEGVPVVLMEAMAMELPCVSTWVNGIPELIQDKEDGLLVAPSDVAGLAEAIRTLLENPELRLRLGRAGRQKVLQKYDLAANAAGLAQVFRKYLSAGEKNPRPN